MKEEDLVENSVPREWVLFKVSTILMMSDYEEDLGDFPAFSAENRLAEFMVGSYREESTDQWTASSGITKKIPLLDGSTSWFKYEELIDDWLDLTVLEAGKRGPALKNTLVGDAEMHKGLLNRESLRAQDGVKYFRDTLSPHLSNELSVFSSGFDFDFEDDSHQRDARHSSLTDDCRAAETAHKVCTVFLELHFLP